MPAHQCLTAPAGQSARGSRPGSARRQVSRNGSLNPEKPMFSGWFKQKKATLTHVDIDGHHLQVLAADHDDAISGKSNP